MNEELSRILRRIFGAPPIQPGRAPNIPWTDDAPLEPKSPRVLTITFNPVMDERTGKRMIEYMGWNNVERLCEGIIGDIREASGGLLDYRIVERIDVDEWTVLEDGYRYDPETWLGVMRHGSPMHKPDMLDYNGVIDRFDLINRVARDEIDEVWLWGYPYGGFYESRMVGEDSYWCNAPECAHPGMNKRFVIMGFNYERLVGEALEAMGHRIESIMSRVYTGTSGEDNLWAYFMQHEHNSPGQAQVGWMHYAPNSIQDYDWANPRTVMSACDDWLNFPHLTGEMRAVNCADWGGGGIREHHNWWMHRLPKAAGRVNGIRANWWHYVAGLDPSG
jgi:hypothetical protein